MPAKVPWVELQCQHCGHLFSKPPSQARTAKFCSRACKDTAQTQMGRTDVVVPSTRRNPNIDEGSIPYGYCHCGCGQKTPLARQTVTKLGYVKGEPVKYIFGHINRGRPAHNAGAVAINGFKECADCGAVKPLSHFWKTTSSRDGHVGFCRDCAPLRCNESVRDRYWQDVERSRMKKRLGNHLRRTRDAAVEGVWTIEDIELLYTDQEGACAYCGTSLEDGYHIDHMTPPHRGGTHWPANLCLACPRCNWSKNDRTAEEFRTYLASLATCSPDTSNKTA